ncbi:MAG TPA: hypothetical protein DCL09_02525 [Sutterella sp.]|nr:hypothetical protein [Sutterella sp.]
MTDTDKKTDVKVTDPKGLKPYPPAKPDADKKPETKETPDMRRARYTAMRRVKDAILKKKREIPEGLEENGDNLIPTEISALEVMENLQAKADDAREVRLRARRLKLTAEETEQIRKTSEVMSARMRAALTGAVVLEDAEGRSETPEAKPQDMSKPAEKEPANIESVEPAVKAVALPKEEPSAVPAAPAADTRRERTSAAALILTAGLAALLAAGLTGAAAVHILKPSGAETELLYETAALVRLVAQRRAVLVVDTDRLQLAAVNAAAANPKHCGALKTHYETLARDVLTTIAETSGAVVAQKAGLLAYAKAQDATERAQRLLTAAGCRGGKP